jgi:SprT-like family
MLTPERLAAVYECLRSFPPFNRYGLPHADTVEFKLIRKHDRAADYTAFIRAPDQHLIRLNPDWHSHFDTIASTMAHEMLHLHQRVKKLNTSSEHNADFRAKAVRICRRYGWDPKTFV